MTEIKIKISNRKAKEWDYCLSLRYGKRSKLNQKCLVVILEKIAEIANIEAQTKVNKIP